MAKCSVQRVLRVGTTGFSAQGVEMYDDLMGYAQALRLTLESISALPAETLPVWQLSGRVAAEDLCALVDAPSADVSLKDGYAVRSDDVAQASATSPVRLRVIGAAQAGSRFAGEVATGTAVRVLSGACVPYGAEAVVSGEFASDDGGWVTVTADAAPGRNILRRGTDVMRGQLVAVAGTRLRPAQVGLLAAAGYGRAPVVRRPRIAIIATGDEVIAPGKALGTGQLYASNLVTLAAWCAHYGFETAVSVVPDEAAAIQRRLAGALDECDAVITSGGAWTGERDLVVHLLDELPWHKVYHKVKLGPGKAVAFGLARGKPVFCLPGGPPSNQMAFLQLALPGLLKLAGYRRPHLPEVAAILAEPVEGQIDWTQFVGGRLERSASGDLFHPLKLVSRLQSMAQAEALLAIPEGTARIPQGARVRVQLLPGVLTASDLDGATAPPRQKRPAVVSFVAKSGTGKTTFLEKLVPVLKARGLRVGVLKHHAHATPFDIPGKDTYRMAQAGADVVVGACSVQVAVFHQEDGSADLDAVIDRHLAGVDLVLVEGYKRGDYAKIEVHRAACHADLLCAPEELLALITDEPHPAPVRQFALDDLEGVADFLEEWIHR